MAHTAAVTARPVIASAPAEFALPSMNSELIQRSVELVEKERNLDTDGITEQQVQTILGATNRIVEFANSAAVKSACANADATTTSAEEFRAKFVLGAATRVTEKANAVLARLRGGAALPTATVSLATRPLAVMSQPASSPSLSSPQFTFTPGAGMASDPYSAPVRDQDWDEKRELTRERERDRDRMRDGSASVSHYTRPVSASFTQASPIASMSVSAAPGSFAIKPGSGKDKPDLDASAQSLHAFAPLGLRPSPSLAQTQTQTQTQTQAKVASPLIPASAPVSSPSVSASGNPLHTAKVIVVHKNAADIRAADYGAKEVVPAILTDTAATPVNEAIANALKMAQGAEIVVIDPYKCKQNGKHTCQALGGEIQKALASAGNVRVIIAVPALKMDKLFDGLSAQVKGAAVVNKAGKIA